MPLKRGVVIAPDQAKPNTASGEAMPALAKRRRNPCAKGRVSAATDETLYGSICASVAAGSSGTRAALSPKSRPMESISAAMVGCRWKCLWALT